jgi:hypothetical protein
MLRESGSRLKSSYSSVLNPSKTLLESRLVDITPQTVTFHRTKHYCDTAYSSYLLRDFRHYFNGYRTHAGLGGRLPEPGVEAATFPINIASYRWQKHCRGHYQTPVAARFFRIRQRQVW